MRESGVVIQTVEGFRMRKERREEGNQPFCQERGVCRRREEVVDEGNKQVSQRQIL